MKMDRALLLERLARRILSIRLPHPTRVGIDGIDTAGKSTFAAALAAALRSAGPRQVLESSIDRFHRPRAERYRLGRESPEGYYQDSYNLAGLRRVLLDPLGPAGGAAERQVRLALFDLAADAPLDLPPVTAAPDAVLVFDGIFLQRPELAGCWDLTIFLQIDEATMLARAVERDQGLLGGPQAAAEMYARRYLPAQRRYLAEHRPAEKAAILIGNDDPAMPDLLRE